MSFRVSIVGEPDLFTAIYNAGCLRPRRPGKPTNGLYDGWDEVMTHGEARLLIKSTGLAPDDMRQSLSESGFHFDSVSDMYDAIDRAASSRAALRVELKNMASDLSALTKLERQEARQKRQGAAIALKELRDRARKGEHITMNYTKIVARKKTNGKVKLFIVGESEAGKTLLFRFKPVPSDLGFDSVEAAVAHVAAEGGEIKAHVGVSVPYKLLPTDLPVIDNSVATEPATEPVATPKPKGKGGRPAGSKNKPKSVVDTKKAPARKGAAPKKKAA